MKKQRTRRPVVDHSACECHVLQRGPHWGLFCIPHGAYIKWLSAAELNSLRTMNMAWIADPRRQAADPL